MNNDGMSMEKSICPSTTAFRSVLGNGVSTIGIL
jgi:hypothetical protein